MKKVEVFFLLTATVRGEPVQASGVVTASSRQDVYEYALDKIRSAVSGTVNVLAFTADPNQF